MLYDTRDCESDLMANVEHALLSILSTEIFFSIFQLINLKFSNFSLDFNEYRISCKCFQNRCREHLDNRYTHLLIYYKKQYNNICIIDTFNNYSYVS